MEKELTQEQKLELVNELEKVIGSKGLNNLYNTFINNKEYIINKEVIVEKDEPEVQSNSINNTPDQNETIKKSSTPEVIASIYAIDALPLVEEDLKQREKELNNDTLMKSNNEELTVYKDEKANEQKNDFVLADISEKENDINNEKSTEDFTLYESFDKAPVLERKLTNNNPWSGIETVAPGTLKL